MRREKTKNELIQILPKEKWLRSAKRSQEEKIRNMLLTL